MTLNWQKSESTTKPLEVDYESSSTTIFIHRKIHKIEKDGQIYYEYEEAKLTPSEYTVYVAEQNRQNILAVMEGLASIYDQIGG